MKPFQLFYVDCGWRYNDPADAGKRGAGHKYTVTSTADLVRMPVERYAADNSVLLMWATRPMIIEALSVMSMWGFTYKTEAFTWIKHNLSNGVPSMGMGHYTRANSEAVLLGVKGRGLKRFDKGVPQVVNTLGRGAHSEKPDHIVIPRIMRLYGDVRRVELFARREVRGWYRWGDEAPDGGRRVLTQVFAPPPRVAA